MNNNIVYGGKLNKTVPPVENHKHHKAVFVALFGIIFLTSGFGVPTFLEGTMILCGCLFFTLLLALSYMSMRININLLIVTMLLLASILATSLFHGDEIKQFIIYIVYIIIAFTISQTLRDDFNIIYVKLFYFLSIFSLAMWIIYLIFPAVIRVLPVISNEHGRLAYTALFSTISSFGNMGLSRNQGIFWEPGAYQTFVNIAAIIVLFTNHFKEKKLKYTIVFALTIFTTFSTTGYIVFCGLVLSYCLSELLSSKTTSKYLKYIAILMFVAVVFLAVYSMLPQDIQIQLFGKLAIYFNNTDRISSTSIRVDAFTNGIKAFLDYPLLGCGITKLSVDGSYTDVIMTCTPVNYFAFYGLFVGIICNLGLFMYSKSLIPKNTIAIAVFICLALSIISENYMRDPIIFTLIFLGLSKSAKNQSNDGLKLHENSK